MFLYLVRHGEARSEEEDPSRGLSEKGLDDVKRVAACIADLNINVNRIFHSGKTRALQTAQVLADHLNPKEGVSQADGLTPLDEPEIWFERLSGINDDIALVGHLPYMGKLAALLLCGDKERDVVGFKTGGVACLKSYEGCNWSLEWMIIPELIKR